MCSLALFALTRAAGAPVAAIYAVLLLLGTARAFAGPATQSLVPHLVPTDHLTNAITWNSITFEAATIIGPALGGLVYGWGGGPGPVYASSAALTGVSFFFLLSMRVRTGRMEKKAVSLEQLLAGIRFVWNQKMVLGAISLDLFAVLLGGAVALLPIYARDILHTGPWGLGLLRSAPAVGAGAMALLLAFRPLQRRVGVRMFCVRGALRSRHHRLRPVAQLPALARRAGGARRGGHGERGHPHVAGAAGHARRDARPGERGEPRLRRRLQRARRVRVRRHRRPARRGAGGGGGRGGHAGRGGAVEPPVPAARRINRVEDAAAYRHQHTPAEAA